MTGTEGPILRLKGVEVVYSDVILVLRGVSLQVPVGSVVALLGANGAGKTTTLRAITGLLPIHRGRITKGGIEVDGRPVDDSDPADIVSLGVSQVMEGRRIFAELTVDENLRAGGFTRRDKSEVKASYDRVMGLFPKLADRRRSIAGYLSGGEQQMLAMARALMQSPRLLLLDEPSLGLAPLIVREIFRIISELRASGVAILLVEQNARAALQVADYGYVLETGELALEGASEDLAANPRVAATYLGRSAAAS